MRWSSGLTWVRVGAALFVVAGSVDDATQGLVRARLGIVFGVAAGARDAVRRQPGGGRIANARAGAHQAEGFDEPAIGEQVGWVSAPHRHIVEHTF
jgi:hypothetical protein